MGEREWQPGDVAMVHNRWGVENLAICSLAANIRSLVWKYGVSDSMDLVDDPARYARPLVVIDPEDREQVERLRDMWDDAHEAQQGHKPPPSARGARGNALQAALREFANPSPVKPDEPRGLGAVVEDADGDRWVRRSDECPPPWVNAAGATFPQSWSRINAVTILSEGVTP